MRIAVKICGFTRAEDISSALEAGVDAVGVVFDRGPRKVSLRTARELLEATRGAAVERVAVVGTLGPKACEEIAELGFDVLQAVARQARVEQPGPLPVLPVFFDSPDLLVRVRRWRRSQGVRSEAKLSPGSLLGAVNLDGMGGGGTGALADWTRAREMALAEPLVLSGGLTRHNVERALRMVTPHGVDVCSGVESAPGIKDPSGMRAFVEEVRRLEVLLAEAA